MWAKGYSIYKISFSRYNTSFIVSESYLDQRIPTSGVDVYVKFKTDLTENIVCLIYTSYIESLLIKSDQANTRNVELNYSL